MILPYAEFNSLILLLNSIVGLNVKLFILCIFKELLWICITYLIY